MTSYASVLYRFSRYSRLFDTPHLHLAPSVGGVTPIEFRGVRKLESLDYSVVLFV